MNKSLPNILRVITLLTLLFFSVFKVLALNIKAGDYYFDNSKLKFNQVKLVVGNLKKDFTQVIDMEIELSHQWWKATIDNDINDVTYYTFVSTTVPEGIYGTSIYLFLDSLASAEHMLRRTNMQSTTNISPCEECRWVFCPFNDSKLSNGYWRPDYSYDVTVSGTLPVIYLNTQDSVTIVSRDYYIQGSLWLDNCGVEGVESIGSSDSLLNIEVKGRGNWTWRNSYKKPYKIKFASKQAPLGLDKSRHFVLLAHNEDYSGYLRNTTGFELSRLLNMPYTPQEKPVELVLNGEYQGLYFLCEKIRVESGRVDILEQSDYETIPHNVTGGWLLELSYEGKPVIAQYQNKDPNNSWFQIVSQSPENLSSEQRSYIHDFLVRTDSCIYVADKSNQEWERYLDISTVAQFYVIHELLENVEAFSGSLFMYKDLGEDEKLKFGPVWDFDNSFFQDSTTSDHFIFDYESQFSFLWIKELLKFPRFQKEVRLVWRTLVYNGIIDKLITHAWQWREQIIDAEQNDKLRWPIYASTHVDYKPQEYLDVIANKAKWLNTQWGVKGDVNFDGAVTVADVTAIYDFLLTSSTNNDYSLDVNGDGLITVADITAIYNIILYPSQDW